jgi:hypothetical protein
LRLLLELLLKERILSKFLTGTRKLFNYMKPPSCATVSWWLELLDAEKLQLWMFWLMLFSKLVFHIN